jgi:hypothetical protein
VRRGYGCIGFKHVKQSHVVALIAVGREEEGEGQKPRRVWGGIGGERVGWS